MQVLNIDVLNIDVLNIDVLNIDILNMRARIKKAKCRCCKNLSLRPWPQGGNRQPPHSQTVYLRDRLQGQVSKAEVSSTGWKWAPSGLL